MTNKIKKRRKLLDMSKNSKMKEKKRKKLIKDPLVTLLHNMENMWSILNF